MPVYNGQRWLAAAVESILAQTYNDLEFIVVDDGSGDGTWECLCRYAQSDPRLVLLRNTSNIGYTRSLNLGLKIARGLFMARQDADDLSHPERLAMQVAFLESNPAVGAVGTAIELIDENGKHIASPPVIQQNDRLQSGLLHDFCVHHGSVMARMSGLAQIGHYDASLEPTEDHDLWLRLAEQAELANLPERLYQYRRHSTSVSSQRSGDQRFRMSQSIERAYLRRCGSVQHPAARRQLALSYFYAAVTYASAGCPDPARQCLARARVYWPEVLDSTESLLQSLDHFTGHLSLREALDACDEVFARLLPRRVAMDWLKARIVSQLYMRRAFAESAQDEYLWAGLLHNPLWLANRGVLARVGRSLGRSVTGVMTGR